MCVSVCFGRGEWWSLLPLSIDAGKHQQGNLLCVTSLPRTGRLIASASTHHTQLTPQPLKVDCISINVVTAATAVCVRAAAAHAGS